MPDETPIICSFKEFAEMFVKQRGIHEGLWGIFVRFGIKALNVNFETEGSSPVLTPTALVPLVEIGIQRFPEPNDYTVDAAVVNPRKTTKSAVKRSKSKKVRKPT